MAAGEILAVDLPAFERGDDATRRGIVSAVRESLGPGFVYVRHDLAEEFIGHVRLRAGQRIIRTKPAGRVAIVRRLDADEPRIYILLTHFATHNTLCFDLPAVDRAAEQAISACP